MRDKERGNGEGNFIIFHPRQCHYVIITNEGDFEYDGMTLYRLKSLPTSRQQKSRKFP